MRLTLFKKSVLLVVILLSCGSKNNDKINETFPEEEKNSIIVGANQLDVYLPLLKNKSVGIVANQTSVIFKNNSYKHLVDSLLSLKVNIKKVFAPEHGFRGTADAGELIKNGKDLKTGLDIISLYGKNKKPNAQQLADIDIVLFDIQDVGARFYTYISSLHYVMEACAEQGKTIIVLDRPNPNGHYIDGPILENEYKSFVGMHPVPIVHGLTIGEYAKMINGEHWLNGEITCDLIVIPMKNYSRTMAYNLPINPSPNLPNSKSINLYPSLCFFEGTPVSVGRGTETQFQVIGHPDFKNFNFTFTPKPNLGSKSPKHNNMLCFGIDLQQHKKLNSLELNWLINAYKTFKELHPNKPFFNAFFKKLAGTNLLQKQIENGLTETQIKKSWEIGLSKYKKMSSKYYIYD